MATEYLLSLNKFNKPKELTGNDTISLLITRLILLEPGSFQSHPDMGVGIISKYRYSEANTGVVFEIKNRIQDQMNTYLPLEFGTAKVDITEIQGVLRIEIQIEDTLYEFDFDSSKNTLESVKTK